MFKYSLYITLTCLILLSESRKYSSLDKIFTKGLEAYSGERWSECIVQFEESLHLYKLYKSTINNCRLKCKSYNNYLVKDNIEELKMFELYFNRNNCLTNCLNNRFEELKLFINVSDSILSNMHAKKPYEYLHVCYFHMNALPKAASAAYTYLVANPNEDTMKNNVEYYVQQPEVDPNEVVDLESQDFKILYKLGIQAYNKNNWEETVANLEECLIDYFAWENSCRAECERQPEQEWISEITVLFSNYMASLLTCNQKCQDELKPLYNSGVEFLADVLNHLQISYYHLDRIEHAAKAVTSYLVLVPNDEDMLENKKIYQTITNSKAFVERSDITYYSKRDRYEKILLDLFQEESNNDITSNTVFQ